MSIIIFVMTGRSLIIPCIYCQFLMRSGIEFEWTTYWSSWPYVDGWYVHYTRSSRGKFIAYHFIMYSLWSSEISMQIRLSYSCPLHSVPSGQLPHDYPEIITNNVAKIIKQPFICWTIYLVIHTTVCFVICQCWDTCFRSWQVRRSSSPSYMAVLE